MEVKIIFVSRKEGTNRIKLRDSEGHGVGGGTDDITTTVSADDYVIWVLDQDSGLESIDKIEPKDGSPIILQATPTNLNPVLVGRVKPKSPGKDIEEDYKIYYTIQGEQHSDDPKLKMDD